MSRLPSRRVGWAGCWGLLAASRWPGADEAGADGAMGKGRWGWLGLMGQGPVGLRLMGRGQMGQGQMGRGRWVRAPGDFRLAVGFPSWPDMGFNSVLPVAGHGFQDFRPKNRK